jgi:hypothetical protein
MFEIGLMNSSAQGLLPMRNRPVTRVLTFGRCATDFSCLLNIYRHASPFMGGFVSGRRGAGAQAPLARFLGRTVRRDKDDLIVQ